MQKRCPDFASILRDTPADETIREQIAACFYQELGRVAKRLCRDESLAQDALQDALENGLRRLETFRGDASLQTWLKKLVASACTRLRRGRKNDPRFNQPLDETTPTLQQESQEVKVLMQERLSILAETLADMDEVNRRLLIEHEGEGTSLEELAGRYELSVEAVKSRLKRIRATVRERLLSAAEEMVD